MSVTDDDRRHLHEMFRDRLDERAASTVMEMLPHAGWSDLTRRTDLVATEMRLLAEINRRFGETDRKFGEIDRHFGEMERRFGEIHRRISTLVTANIALVVGVLVSTAI
jgi:hypothetical protein